MNREQRYATEIMIELIANFTDISATDVKEVYSMEIITGNVRDYINSCAGSRGQYKEIEGVDNEGQEYEFYHCYDMQAANSWGGLEEFFIAQIGDLVCVAR